MNVGKLNLLKREEQKNWALVLNGKAPTIEQWKRAPEKYANRVLEHGFYEVIAEIKDVWSNDPGINIKVHEGNVRVFGNAMSFVKYIDKGCMNIRDGYIIVTGRFDKRGAEILFIPGLE